MMALLCGPSGSGKSLLAEMLAQRWGKNKLYVATMEPFGDEAAQRIRRHRQQRQHKGFLSVDRYTDIGALHTRGCDTVLLECMGNLLANELYAPGGAGDRADTYILQGITALYERCTHLIVVTNEVGASADEYSSETWHYIELLGRINCLLARQSDLVAEVICGVPHFLRGEELW